MLEALVLPDVLLLLEVSMSLEVLGIPVVVLVDGAVDCVWLELLSGLLDGEVVDELEEDDDGLISERVDDEDVLVPDCD